MRQFVLSGVAKEDRDLLESTETLAARAVEILISGGIEKAMAEFNGVDLREGQAGPPDQREAKDN
jgi:peptidyl-tRNA hydrolase